MEKLNSNLLKTPAKNRNADLCEKVKQNIKLIEEEKGTIDQYIELLEYEQNLVSNEESEILYDLSTKKPLREFSPNPISKGNSKNKPSSAKSMRSSSKKESQNIKSFKCHFSGILEELRLKLIENRLDEKALLKFFESKESNLTYRDLLDIFQKKPFLMEMSVELEQLCRFIVDSESLVHNHENAVSNKTAFECFMKLLDKFVVLPEDTNAFVIEKNRKLLENPEAYELIHGFLKFKAQSCEFLGRSIIKDLFNRLDVELLEIELDVLMSKLLKICGSLEYLQPFKLFDVLGLGNDPSKYKKNDGNSQGEVIMNKKLMPRNSIKEEIEEEMLDEEMLDEDFENPDIVYEEEKDFDEEFPIYSESEPEEDYNF